MGRLIKPPGIAAALAAGLSLALLLPAQAQFWNWGGPPPFQQQQQQQQQQRPQNNPFGGLFDVRPAPQQAPVDHSRAPAPTQKKPDATTSIVVMGDANADWLAYGLEDAFSDKPEIAIVRKHRTDSGLIRYDGRRDTEWSQVAREILAAEKPKFIIMMIGNNDRQQIRERAQAAARPVAPKAAASPAQPAAAPAAGASDPEQQPAEAPPEPPPQASLTPEQARQAFVGPWEFHTEKWEAAYIRRIDATIAVLKSAGVPVMWVGLPSQRGPKTSADSAYLNEIYRSRAEKAGIVYIDVWDGFVDDSGRFSPQGPDYEGQTRRLRSADGVYFTKFGARKLAHYVEREIQRNIANRGMPVALPVPDSTPLAPNARGGPSQRPAAGPVVPLTAAKVVPEDLIGGGRVPARAPAGDQGATRVLVKGEPVAAPTGRADDFSWPRGSAAFVEPEPVAAPAAAVAPPAAAKPARPAATAQRAADGQGGQTSLSPAEQRPPLQRRPRPNPDAPPRPPQGVFPGLFR